mgnify:CR=1 FL=1
MDMKEASRGNKEKEYKALKALEKEVNLKLAHDLYEENDKTL